MNAGGTLNVAQSPSLREVEQKLYDLCPLNMHKYVDANYTSADGYVYGECNTDPEPLPAAPGAPSNAFSYDHTWYIVIKGLKL